MYGGRCWLAHSLSEIGELAVVLIGRTGGDPYTIAPYCICIGCPCPWPCPGTCGDWYPVDGGGMGGVAGYENGWCCSRGAAGDCWREEDACPFLSGTSEATDPKGGRSLS